MKDVVCLYETSGFSARDWALDGFGVYCYDNTHENDVEVVGLGYIFRVKWDATHPDALNTLLRFHAESCRMLLAYPPCTDLAVSGAAWFAAKMESNPRYREEAMALVYLARDFAEITGTPYCIENPVSVISTQWRKPDHIFHPWEYGGYLPEDDVHPVFPDYIEPRDAYPKKTCYWTGNGFVMPCKQRVEVAQGYSKQHRLLGGKSDKTKRIRNASPRGIARAIFEANK